MNNDICKELRIDPEFSELIVPLSSDEYCYLEQNIRREGCFEPLMVWKNIIVDGHDRYQICIRWGIPFQIKQIDFVDREDAISWICSMQLGRHDISEESRRYLIGRQYDAEKMTRRRKARTDGSFPAHRKKTAVKESFASTDQVRCCRKTTSQKLAEKYHLSHATVEKYVIYSHALDSICKKSPSMFHMILSGKYAISQENVIMLSQMDEASIQKLKGSLEKKKQRHNAPIRVFSDQIQECFLGKEVPVLQPQIKSMPAYDPDAEISGLVFTIPSWNSSLSKLRNNADLTITSPGARKKLDLVLSELMNSIRIILHMIRSVDGDC